MSPVNKKRVSFSDTVQQHILYDENDEYKTYRKEYWKFVAADRHRFERRIAHIEKILTPILNSDYRKLYLQRKV